jgi:hypothetical protein
VIAHATTQGPALIATKYVTRSSRSRLVYLSADGRAFEHAHCGGFVPMRLDFAIEQALCTWWILSGWDAQDAEAVGDAVVRAAGSLHG